MRTTIMPGLDSCFVEPKNWAVVRRLAGYERLEALVSTVLQQILQHVGVADAIAVSDAADAGRRQIAVC